MACCDMTLLHVATSSQGRTKEEGTFPSCHDIKFLKSSRGAASLSCRDMVDLHVAT